MDLSVKKELKQEYEDCYHDGQTSWRKVGAKGKYENIIALTQGLKFDKICEIGAGDGSILELLATIDFAPSMYALEISEKSLQVINSLHIKNLVEATKFDGYQIPYPDNFFDLVVLSHVLEHVEYPRFLLREIKRVSKYQFIEVPREYHHNIDKQVERYLSYGHIDVYTPSYLKFLLKSEDFEIIKERKGFYSNDVLLFSKTGFQAFKTNMAIFIRNIAYLLLPEWRKDIMINYCSVLTK